MLSAQAHGVSYTHITFLTFQAVVQVVIICLAGFWAARTGLLNGAGMKTLSRLNVDLFTPALIFTKLASSLSLQKLIDVIVIPIFFLVTTGVSFLSSKAAARVLRLDVPESNFVTAMAVFGNSNSLPVSLTLSLSYTLPGLKWKAIEGDTRDAIASRGILYLLIFQQLGQVLRWSWGYNSLLKRQVPKAVVNSDQSSESDLLVPNSDTASYGAREDEEAQLRTPLSDSSDSLLKLTSRSLSEFAQPENTFRSRLVQIFRGFLAWMNPPLWSMFLSVFIASVPAIRYEFFECNGFIQNTLALAIKQLGSVSIPLILVVLGANLAPSSEIPPPSAHYARIIIGSLVSRMVLPSLILLPLIGLCTKYISLSILSDPIFLIVSFILTVSPPAIQLSQICQLNEIFEREMAGVLFWGYVVLTLPTTIAIVVASLETLNWAQAGKIIAESGY
ncbi:unnamed protein product [Kuraishia capsulata CBS 1993]|uniref:Auxin efflux carrier n=1 Tax=Kuraishia capsulata CBS 1993 TaxID=1382522 RepID=W6MPG7_9ASCO|nr:uncharacterized protein KUCA_T00002974001 [Kuraishia capsulata CBS 1993]CDK26997.1 unnamed protein product [Kuraishia capsulata CBS 1993]